MFDNLFLPELPVPNLVLRAALVFFAMVALLRISGKRQIGQLSAIEFVVILLISNAVQNAMNGGDNSLAAGLVLAATLIALSMGFAWLTYRSRFLSRVLEGTPTLLIHKGRLIRHNLEREWLTESELRALLRKHGVQEFKEIDNAILEADGSLSISRKGHEEYRFEEE